jgi:hypothetical protein
MSSSDYYPLAVGNTWTYKMKDGKTFTNTVTGVDGATFAMSNSMTPAATHVKKNGSDYLTDSFEAGKWLVMLKDGLKKGDTWQVNSILIYTVKEVGISKEVEGRTYSDVVFIEAESKLNMNGNIIPMNFLTQYYYAKGVGLVLTTSSVGDAMPLTAYEVK